MIFCLVTVCVYLAFIMSLRVIFYDYDFLCGAKFVQYLRVSVASVLPYTEFQLAEIKLFPRRNL